MTDRAQEPSWAQEAVNAAGGLDLLLTDAALGMMRRLQKKSPGQLGRKGYPMRGAAPGTHVHDH